MTLKSVAPGSPADIIGWDTSPIAGDQFVASKEIKKTSKKQRLKKIKTN